MSKIASLGLAEKATKVGLWRYCFSENDRCCAFLIDKTVEGAWRIALLVSEHFDDGRGMTDDDWTDLKATGAGY
jgi:hypothetical protein